MCGGGRWLHSGPGSRWLFSALSSAEATASVSLPRLLRLSRCQHLPRTQQGGGGVHPQRVRDSPPLWGLRFLSAIRVPLPPQRPSPATNHPSSPVASVLGPWARGSTESQGASPPPPGGLLRGLDPSSLAQPRGPCQPLPGRPMREASPVAGPHPVLLRSPLTRLLLGPQFLIPGSHWGECGGGGVTDPPTLRPLLLSAELPAYLFEGPVDAVSPS